MKEITVSEVSARLQGLTAVLQGRLYAAARKIRECPAMPPALVADALIELADRVTTDAERVRLELTKGLTTERAG